MHRGSNRGCSEEYEKNEDPVMERAFELLESGEMEQILMEEITEPVVGEEFVSEEVSEEESLPQGETE
jgi:hypothetical protein